MQNKNEYYIAEMTDIQSLEVDTLKGLSSTPKYLLSKYFYDDAGSAIFQEITKMPEYYLTRSEQEIFENQKGQITDAIISGHSRFDLLELGSGDGSKTKILLKQLLQKKSDFKYIPVDISSKANSDLVRELNKEIPSLNISPLTGDFFGLTDAGNINSDTSKVILFLGSNIGNFTEPEIDIFLTQLSDLCKRGDKILIGFDLKKSPEIIMQAEMKQIHNDLNVTVLMVTHDLNEAFSLGNEVVIMHNGKILQTDKPENILKAPASEWVKEFVSAFRA